MGASGHIHKHELPPRSVLDAQIVSALSNTEPRSRSRPTPTGLRAALAPLSELNLRPNWSSSAPGDNIPPQVDLPGLTWPQCRPRRGLLEACGSFSLRRPRLCSPPYLLPSLFYVARSLHSPLFCAAPLPPRSVLFCLTNSHQTGPNRIVDDEGGGEPARLTEPSFIRLGEADFCRLNP